MKSRDPMSFGTSIQRSVKTHHWAGTASFLFAIWLIWQQRNHVVFRGKRANPQLAKAIVAQAMEYTLCINRPNCNQPWVTKQISWERPDRGWFKLNTNGAALGPTNRAGCGGLIRNDQVNWLMGFSRNFGQANSFMAECWALRDGLLLCLQQNLQNIVIELDASALVAALNSPMYVNTMVSPLFDDCRQLVGRFSRCCIRHIYREANMCADKLSKLGLVQDLEFVLHHSPPVDLVQLIEDDKCGLYSNRRCPAPLSISLV